MKEMCCEFKLKSTHGLLLAVSQHTSKCQDKGLIFTFWPLLMLRCMSYSCHSLLRHHLPHLFLSIPTFPRKKKNSLIYLNLSLLCMNKLWAASIFMSHLSLDLLPNSIYSLSLPHSIHRTRFLPRRTMH